MKLLGMMSHFLLYLFLMILMWVGAAYVSQNISYSNACHFYRSVVRQMEEQYFDAAVIEQCRRAAKENGYQLTVDLYEKGGKKTARVMLDMSDTFPILKEKRRYTIDGYAR